jgi:eukaryotic-like serine/threonine-protein kinase
MEPDRRFLFIRRSGGIPVRVDRLDLSTGRRERWKELAPADRTGVISISTIFLSADGTAYAYTYQRLLSELYLVEGLK